MGYDVPVFAHMQAEPEARRHARDPGQATRQRITDDQVRGMRQMYEEGMATASQVRSAYPQFSLKHITNILDRKARGDVA